MPKKTQNSKVKMHYKDDGIWGVLKKKEKELNRRWGREQKPTEMYKAGIGNAEKGEGEEKRRALFRHTPYDGGKYIEMR